MSHRAAIPIQRTSVLWRLRRRGTRRPTFAAITQLSSSAHYILSGDLGARPHLAPKAQLSAQRHLGAQRHVTPSPLENHRIDCGAITAALRLNLRILPAYRYLNTETRRHRGLREYASFTHSVKPKIANRTTVNAHMKLTSSISPCLCSSVLKAMDSTAIFRFIETATGCEGDFDLRDGNANNQTILSFRSPR